MRNWRVRVPFLTLQGEAASTAGAIACWLVIAGACWLGLLWAIFWLLGWALGVFGLHITWSQFVAGLVGLFLLRGIIGFVADRKG